MDKSEFAIKLIKRGITLPFSDFAKVNKACKLDIQERKTSKARRRILSKEIEDLLKTKVIEKVPRGTKVFENHIFSKVKSNGKIRVIFDMKILNVDIKLPSLTMFKFPMAYTDMINNSYACKIDLSNAYWHLSVNINYRRFLSFKFKNVIYQWTAMPFGLKTAPYLFCKFMSTLIKHIKVISIPFHRINAAF